MILWSSCFAKRQDIPKFWNARRLYRFTKTCTRVLCRGPKDGPAILEPHAGGETRKVMEDLSSLLSPGATISLYIIYFDLSFFNYTTVGLTSKTWSFWTFIFFAGCKLKWVVLSLRTTVIDKRVNQKMTFSGAIGYLMFFAFVAISGWAVPIAKPSASPSGCREQQFRKHCRGGLHCASSRTVRAGSVRNRSGFFPSTPFVHSFLEAVIGLTKFKPATKHRTDDGIKVL